MARKQKRLTRKDLKEDPLMTALASGQDWLAIHGTKLTLGVVALLVIVFGTVFYGKMQGSAEQEAATVLIEVSSSATGATTEQLVGPLTNVAETYRGTQAGAEARYALAQLAAQDGDYEKAIDQYRSFKEEYSNKFLMTSAAMYGEATALENLGHYKEAAEVYDEVSKRKDASHVRPLALLAAARCFEVSGDLEAARSRFEQAAENEADPAIQDLANLSLAKLNAAR